MDTKTRAEKIVQHIYPAHANKWCIDYVTSQLDEAVREAVDQGPTVLQACQASYREGFAAAREKALEIYKHSGTSEEVEERIRTMEPEK